MFDPTLPVTGSPDSSAEMRSQLTSLKALIDALAAGISGVVVDGVTTLPPSDPATVNLSLVGTELHFSFGIPRGNDALPVPPVTSFVVDSVTTLNPGDPATASAAFDGTSVRLTYGLPRGNNGTNGSDGGVGPPFTNFIADGVTTLNPGEPATAQANFDGTFVRLSFAIPRGDQGGTGGQGPPGEVTNAQLASAMNDTSRVSNAVTTLGLMVSDPPTQTELQLAINKIDELIGALRR